MFNILIELADLISVFPLVICFVLLYNFLIKPSKNKLDLVLFIVIIISNFSVSLLKKLPYPKSWYHITMRPVGASGCDYLSKKGLCKPGTSGMPSGHMTSISIFTVFMILSKIYSLEGVKMNLDDIMFILVNLGLIFLTAFARYYKKCHNVSQIILGTILGSFIGAITFFILKKNNFLVDDKIKSFFTFF